MAGLYIHIPLCKSKCPYCDFYSLTDFSVADEYVESVKREIRKTERSFETVYIGGGTPSLLGAQRLADMLGCVRREPGAEITVECNPSSTDSRLFEGLACAGVNRISMGLQSAVDSERRALGRLSTAEKTAEAVLACKKAGIENISLDVMLGIPRQSMETLCETLSFCLELGVSHISAYMLTLEQGTPFYRKREKLPLPGEDEVCRMYLHTVETLEKNGLRQYEISNFALPGRHSRHNLNYWYCGEYLGIGAAAHSFIDSRRFYYERDIRDFINGKPPVPDGEGGGFEEYAMLRLRLNEGLCEQQVRQRYGHPIPSAFYKRARLLASKGLVKEREDGFALTAEGFLLSNSVIADILYHGEDPSGSVL